MSVVYICQGYLAEMKRSKNGDGKITEDWLLYNVFEMFVAGTETTAFSIVWFILYMTRYPEVQQNIQKEIDVVIGLDTVGLHHRPGMPYAGNNSLGNIVVNLTILLHTYI